MRLLSICTAGKNCSVAILEDGKTIKEFNNCSGLTHSETLLPSIDNILRDTSLELKDMDCYVVSAGPGSFTGIRIGISTIKGFCLGCEKKVVAVPSLLGLAYNVKEFDGYIVSCIDAKNDNVYARIFENDPTLHKIEPKSDYIVDSIDVLINEILSLKNQILIVGDGCNILKEKLQNSNISFANEDKNMEYASSFGLAGMDLINKNEITDGVKLAPLYLKKSQAERELEEKKQVLKNT